MSILTLGPIAFGGVPGIIAFLQSKHVLASSRNCQACNIAMDLQDRSDISDGCRWRCPQCYATMSIRKDSFFERSRLPLQKWLLLMHWWANEYPVTDAVDEIEVSKATAIQIYQYMRDVCSHRLCNIDPPIKLGGRGLTVSIDESLFFP